MPSPAKHLTPFDFYCNSLEELPIIMEKEVGYRVEPRDIWSINVRPFEISKLHITLTIIYWEDKTK